LNTVLYNYINALLTENAGMEMQPSLICPLAVESFLNTDIL